MNLLLYLEKSHQAVSVFEAGGGSCVGSESSLINDFFKRNNRIWLE